MSTNSGASAWIAANLSVLTGPRSSMGSPMTLMIRPRVSAPTGIRMGKPESMTGCPRTKPSYERCFLQDAERPRVPDGVYGSGPPRRSKLVAKHRRTALSNQDEVVMDSELMSVSSKVIKSCTQVLTKEYNTFSSMEFAHKLMEYVQQLPDTTVADVNWSMLRKDVPAFKATATYVNLLNKIMCVGERRNKRDKNGSGDNSLNDSGSNDEARPKGSVKTENILSSQRRNAYAEQHAAKMNRTRLNDPNVTTTRPDNVIQVEGDADNDGNKPILDNLRKLIRKVYKDNGKQQPIDYFKLILDPGDFGKTIENMFHVAFLAKDGFIRFRTGNFSQDYYYYLSIIISTVSDGNCIDFNLVNNYQHFNCWLLNLVLS
ncbi:Similar to EID3: EP300-interacting inhibitor of differentiation 3 (Bos taurus) [Cotesia congregata]|uniref:Non-structural maintenance of chromosomes element 4 n=1 Tax=Cotesia congregata TaxID=51543 RepID=A0A8J2HE64_COTCN|nr:Similar to EID3: EP300-interacting inhibitor of differentiation 3 (Bos taurus) [Cotesia congregata]